ncbi:hypothetical protein HQ520_11060, partial [bacterium]|nr:hypothetical protein [bacterium]
MDFLNRRGTLPGIHILLPAILCLALLTATHPAAPALSPPAGLEPVRHLPENIRVQSLPDQILIDVVSDSMPQNSPLEFFLVAPPAATLRPVFLDYLLERNGPPTELQERDDLGSFPLTLSPSDEPRAESLRQDLTPSKWVKVTDEGIARFWRIIRFSVEPRTVNLGPDAFYRFKSLQVSLPFEKPVHTDAALAETQDISRGYPLILNHLVANPEALPLYADRAQGSPNTPPIDSPWRPDPTSGHWFEIPIATDNLTCVTTRHLKDAGLDPAKVNPAHLSIHSRGDIVPALFIGNEDDTFDQGDALFFYGQSSESKYSHERAYWVRVSEQPAPESSRMKIQAAPGLLPLGAPTVSATWAELTIEEDEELLLRQDNFLSIKEHAWIWKPILDTEPALFPFEVPWLDPRSTGSLEIEIDFYFHGTATAAPLPAGTPPLIIQINDAPPIQLKPFETERDMTRTIAVTPDHIHPRNLLVIRFQGPLAASAVYGQLYMNHFKVRYRRNLLPTEGRLEVQTEGETPWHRVAGFTEAPLVFDLTEPSQPEILQVLPLPGPRGFNFHAFHAPTPDRRLLLVSPSTIWEAETTVPLVSTGLTSAGQTADYLLIYHPRFIKEIQPLLEFQKRQGLEVRSVDVREIFQHYNQGESSPRAIKDFLYDALRSWSRPPTYVVLFGDASSDYRDELKSG